MESLRTMNIQVSPEKEQICSLILSDFKTYYKGIELSIVHYCNNDGHIDQENT
jgi:hypothetical protein